VARLRRLLARGVLSALALLAPALGGRALAGEPVVISVLSYNTHGLAAWIADDDPETRFPEISSRLNAYDVALVQEDFSYHRLLVAGAEHGIVVKGNAPRPGVLRLLGIDAGSGLTSLARPAPDALIASNDEYLGVCSGYLSRASDCLASKGFLRVRVRFEGGHVLDLYNTHLDAGRSPQDIEVRRSQLAALRGWIATLSGNGAFVIGGDFNLSRDREHDAALLAAFKADMGLRDAGAMTRRDEPWSRLDYILYRSGPELELSVVEAGVAREFEYRGKPLSDHPALFARFELRPTRTGRPPSHPGLPAAPGSAPSRAAP
jgi:hypothetical protein